MSMVVGERRQFVVPAQLVGHPGALLEPLGPHAEELDGVDAVGLARLVERCRQEHVAALHRRQRAVEHLDALVHGLSSGPCQCCDVCCTSPSTCGRRNGKRG